MGFEEVREQQGTLAEPNRSPSTPKHRAVENSKEPQTIAATGLAIYRIDVSPLCACVTAGFAMPYMVSNETVNPLTISSPLYPSSEFPRGETNPLYNKQSELISIWGPPWLKETHVLIFRKTCSLALKRSLPFIHSCRGLLVTRFEY